MRVPHHVRSADIIAAGLAISRLRYRAEPGLRFARSRVFDSLPGFQSDSLPDAWGMLLLTRRLLQLGHRFDDLAAIDRLAPVGTSGRRSLVFCPATLARDTAESIDLDLLVNEARQILLDPKAESEALLVRLGGGFPQKRNWGAE